MYFEANRFLWLFDFFSQIGILAWTQTDLRLLIAILVLKGSSCVVVFQFCCENMCCILTFGCVTEAYGGIWMYAGA